MQILTRRHSCRIEPFSYAVIVRSPQHNSLPLSNDIVILQQFAVSRFPNMASPDAFLFASSQALYFYSNGKFFQIVDDRENGGKKPVELDIASFDDYY